MTIPGTRLIAGRPLCYCAGMLTLVPYKSHMQVLVGAVVGTLLAVIWYGFLTSRHAGQFRKTVLQRFCSQPVDDVFAVCGQV